MSHEHFFFAALSFFFPLGLRQWRSSADRIVNLNTDDHLTSTVLENLNLGQGKHLPISSITATREYLDTTIVYKASAHDSAVTAKPGYSCCSYCQSLSRLES